ncbi:FkbM family methyltransferase [Desulfobulbus propionicus]
MKKLRRQRKIQPAQTGKNNVSPQPAVSPKKHNSPTAQQELNAVIPYDENLLERSRTQWQFGDWPSLAQLNRDTLQHHPDRAKLALLAAAGRLQTGQNAEARQFVRLAQDWGVSKKLISQILIAGVHNNIGRAYMAKGEDKVALNHFEDAIRLVQPNAVRRLVGEARAVREAVQLGLLPQAAQLMDIQLKDTKNCNGQEQARIKILETEIELLHHELSLAQQRQQLFAYKAAESVSNPIGSEAWKKQLQKKSVSQLGQDLWVLEKTDYKRGGFFVEFGATDGVLLSNTWLLEKEFGWQGICAEPNPKFFEQLKQNRHCIVSNQYIGRETGQIVDFILAGAYGGSREFSGSDSHEKKRTAYATAGQLTTFITISLDDFLEQHEAPHDIDYISIDTEGSEYDLLSTFPFEKWNIRFFTIEHNHSAQRENIFNLLQNHGYLRTECEWDDWYEKIIS